MVQSVSCWTYYWFHNFNVFLFWQYLKNGAFFYTWEVNGQTSSVLIHSLISVFIICQYLMILQKNMRILLTLKVPITTAADDVFSEKKKKKKKKKFFFFFQRKQVLIFHVNRLLGRQFTWNVKTCFLWKIKKKKKKNWMSSATNFAWDFKG